MEVVQERGLGGRWSLLFSRLLAIQKTAKCQASPSFTISWSLLKLMSIESMSPSYHLILCCPFLLLLQSFPASGSFPMSQLFEPGGQSIWSFSFTEYSGLITLLIL